MVPDHEVEREARPGVRLLVPRPVGVLRAGEDIQSYADPAWIGRGESTAGSWDEEPYTGTGFPLDFMIRYHLYRQVFPVSALGRILG